MSVLPMRRPAAASCRCPCSSPLSFACLTPRSCSGLRDRPWRDLCHPRSQTQASCCMMRRVQSLRATMTGAATQRLRTGLSRRQLPPMPLPGSEAKPATGPGGNALSLSLEPPGEGRNTQHKTPVEAYGPRPGCMFAYVYTPPGVLKRPDQTPLDRPQYVIPPQARPRACVSRPDLADKSLVA